LHRYLFFLFRGSINGRSAVEWCSSLAVVQVRSCYSYYTRMIGFGERCGVRFGKLARFQAISDGFWVGIPRSTSRCERWPWPGCASAIPTTHLPNAAAWSTCCWGRNWRAVPNRESIWMLHNYAVIFGSALSGTREKSSFDKLRMISRYARLSNLQLVCL
jgi:hypothetical protein